jgi:hypothetical protein
MCLTDGPSAAGADVPVRLHSQTRDQEWGEVSEDATHVPVDLSRTGGSSTFGAWLRAQDVKRR